MFCWGNTSQGELGLGGQENEVISRPVLSTWSQAENVTCVSCGEGHTLFLTKDGKVYSCGNNDFGQLGHDLMTKRPQVVSTLESYKITAVACGSYHSLAVNEWGQIFSWGCDEFGQLGLGKCPSGRPQSNQPTPKIIKKLAVMHAVQIACGSYHSIALMNNGDMYAWGSNKNGQLGVRFDENHPVLIKSIVGIPFSFVACGGHHSFAITKSGALYGWGKNENGQLGLNDKLDRHYPTLLKNFRSIAISRVVCGEDFSVFLSFDGGVFACGSNRYGQLGHGNNKDEWLPKKIIELMGVQVIQIACGRRHLLVATSSGRLQSCGLAARGQLGFDSSIDCSYVSTPKAIDLNSHHYSDDNIKVKQIFAGGDCCFATLRSNGEELYDSRLISDECQILTVVPETLITCQRLEENEIVEQDLLIYMETVFKSITCINGSFLQRNHFNCNHKNSGVDVANVRQAFDVILKIKNSTIKDLILNCFTYNLMESLNPNPPDAEALRCFISLPLYHEMLNPTLWKTLQLNFAQALVELKPIPLKVLTAWYHTIPRECFRRVIDIFKSIIVYYIQNSNVTQIHGFDKIVSIFESLEILNCMNNSNVFHRRVSVESFYIEKLGEMIDVKLDYINWLGDVSKNWFHICNYPFLFDALCKANLLELDQLIQMHAAMNEATTVALYTMLQGGQPPSQFLQLTVTRENIVSDTLIELSKHSTNELKKPLKVKILGEEAEDGGGVTKEFFLLLIRDILDPKYGMFHYYEDSRNIWFAEESFEDESMYFLIGLICGLAIYNVTIINVNFPLALYKKLLKAPLTLEDLADLDPVLANSLQALLDYENEDVEEVFGLTFEISREVYGSVKVHSLIENGDEIKVNNTNKNDFVLSYVDFIFNKSIQSKFDAFSSGFFKVCGGRVFKLFQPHELMMLVVGNEEYDWAEFERVAAYRGGYTSNDPAIRFFWEVFYEFTENEKRRFLLFLSGCDRVPIQGMKAIKITIQPTNDERYLPVAHTCFNLLDLPRYSTKEKLKYKLLQAMQQQEGFSLV